MLILPRQARDKHRKTTQKSAAVCFLADTLSIGGLPHCFFSGCRDELEEGVRVAELVHDFGMVVASTATVVDR
jgi:hypothetical protein